MSIQIDIFVSVLSHPEQQNHFNTLIILWYVSEFWYQRWPDTWGVRQVTSVSKLSKWCQDARFCHDPGTISIWMMIIKISAHISKMILGTAKKNSTRLEFFKIFSSKWCVSCQILILQDHVEEILRKWDAIDDEIWAKVIVLERNRRVAKVGSV